MYVLVRYTQYSYDTTSEALELSIFNLVAPCITVVFVVQRPPYHVDQLEPAVVEIRCSGPIGITNHIVTYHPNHRDIRAGEMEANNHLELFHIFGC